MSKRQEVSRLLTGLYPAWLRATGRTHAEARKWLRANYGVDDCRVLLTEELDDILLEWETDLGKGMAS